MQVPPLSFQVPRETDPVGRVLNTVTSFWGWYGTERGVGCIDARCDIDFTVFRSKNVGCLPVESFLYKYPCDSSFGVNALCTTNT